jgi:hypothetical protein
VETDRDLRGFTKRGAALGVTTVIVLTLLISGLGAAVAALVLLVF